MADKPAPVPPERRPAPLPARPLPPDWVEKGGTTRPTPR